MNRSDHHSMALLNTAGGAVSNFIHKNIVLCIAVLGAILSSFFVKPDKEYLTYIDYKTIACLFSVLAVVCALRNIRFFTILSKEIVKRSKNTRLCVLALIYITFIGSMLIANDMALLTFLPLGYFALSSTKKEKYMIFTFIMQNISANLGGMLTPFGNPQNLFLYSKFSIPTLEFMGIMLFPFVLSISLITILTIIVVKPEPLEVPSDDFPLNTKRTILYLVLFAISIIMVFRVIPYLVGTIIIFVCLLIFDRTALGKVDYGLLFTFVAFFIFAGNISRMEVVKNFVSSILNTNTLLVTALSCQCISNVPSAILLSAFTDNYKELLLGVNIGGVGTLISSLASLITFRTFSSFYPTQKKKYLLWFSILNFSILAILLFAEELFLLIS